MSLNNYKKGVDSIAFETKPQNKSKPLNSAVLGEVVWLMTQSELHREFQIGAVIQWVVPALIYEQYRLYRLNDKPVGYVSWGRFSAEVESHYVKDPSSLQPKDWQTGDRIWILDWVAPTGETYSIAKDLKNNVFPNDVGRGLRWKASSDTMNIFYLHGKNAIKKARDWENNPTVSFTC